MGDLIMGDQAGEVSAGANPIPENICSACQTITGDALLKTRPFQGGTHYIYYGESRKIEHEYITPDLPGIFHNIFLEHPASTVKTCAACMLFHKAVHGGITLTQPTTMRICLGNGQDLLEVEDVAKVEKERGKAEKAGETPNLDGRGRITIFADYGKCGHCLFQNKAMALIHWLQVLRPRKSFQYGI